MHIGGGCPDLTKLQRVHTHIWPNTARHEEVPRLA